MYKDFVAYDSLKAQPFHLLYLNPHHYTENGSTEVVVNYDLRSVIIIKLRSADASFRTPALSFQDQSRRSNSFHCHIFVAPFVATYLGISIHKILPTYVVENYREYSGNDINRVRHRNKVHDKDTKQNCCSELKKLWQA